MSDTAPVARLPEAPPRLAKDPVLQRIKRELVRIFQTRLAGVVLYGSRARGDDGPDSDIDILVLLKGRIDGANDRWRLAELAADVGYETDEAPSFFLESEDALNRRSIFIYNVLQDGVLL